MSPTSTLPRLPGVYFTPPAPQRPLFPRLDVAAFVGYAERGPTDLPVAVEDMTQFEEVFGGDLPLARDERGEVVYANLPTAVRSFFANGGRRCHVVRVAGRAATAAQFALPGLVKLDGSGDPRLTTVDASGVGRWASRLRIATRLRSLPFAARSFDLVADGLSTTIERDPGLIQPGDVLRVGFVGGARFLVLVDGVEHGGGRLSIRLGGAWRVGIGSASPLEPIQQIRRVGLASPEALDLAGHAWGDATATELEVDGTISSGPRSGDVLSLTMPGGTWLVALREVHDAGPSTIPGSRRIIATGGPAIELASGVLPQTSPPTPLETLERLRFDILPRAADRAFSPVTDLSFGPGGPRWWEDLVLPGSSAAFSAAPSPGQVAEPDDGGRRTPASITAAFLQHRRGHRPRDDRRPLLERTALAGLLAPSEPDGSVRPAAGYLPIGIPGIVAADDFVPPLTAGDDDLARHTADPFVDDALQLVPPGRLMAEAFDRAIIRERRLGGLHALLFVDEVALLAVPDAAHRPWALLPQKLPEPVAPVIPARKDDPCRPNDEAFDDCERPPTVDAVTPASGFRSVATPIVIEGSGFLPDPVEVLIDGLPAEDVVVLSDSILTCRTPLDTSPPSDARGPADVTLRTPDGEVTLRHGFIYLAPPPGPPLPEQVGIALLVDQGFAPLLSVQAAAIRACHGRGDMMALLDLPAHFRAREAIDWQGQLRTALGLSPRRGPGDTDLPVDLSYAALYHPWVLIEPEGGSTPLRAIPANGAVAGLVAARELARAAWIAPANEPLRDVRGLVPDLTRDEWAAMFAEQLNVIRPEASDFRPMSAHTLSDVRELLQVSTRRLLILLRKAVLDRGMDYVFESNHERFRDGVAATLRELLRTMDQAGAFAGETADDSYRIDTGSIPNPPSETEQGRFVALIQVAPAHPAEFITVALTRTAEGSLRVAGA